MILIAALLVVVMAFPTYQTLAQNDGLAKADQNPAESEMGRQPASVPPMALKEKKPRVHFQTVDLKCAKKIPTASVVVGGYVQFQGKNCLTNLGDGDIEIINKTNGFTASVFLHGSDKYQTDLIQLQQGDNEIVIRYREGSGKTVEETVHVRSSSI